jgi:hypothetical protein
MPLKEEGAEVRNNDCTPPPLLFLKSATDLGPAAPFRLSVAHGAPLGRYPPGGTTKVGPLRARVPARF